MSVAGRSASGSGFQCEGWSEDAETFLSPGPHLWYADGLEGESLAPSQASLCNSFKIGEGCKQGKHDYLTLIFHHVEGVFRVDHSNSYLSS